jgi:hypothetical protein
LPLFRRIYRYESIPNCLGKREYPFCIRDFSWVRDDISSRAKGKIQQAAKKDMNT